MADRKETPDILAEILGGESSTTPSGSPESASRPAPARKASRRTASRTRTKRQRWEYMEVVFRDYGGYRPRFINGVEQVGWKQAPVIHEFLAQVGEQGWELAGVGSREDMEMPAYFKRLKSS